MITFHKLWENHPTVKGDDDPCTTDGKKNFQNQCAIRVGTALARCGYDTRRIPGVRHCWHHEKTQGHILAAEELAEGLMRAAIPGVSPVARYSAETFADEMDGKTGIVFFKDYWQRRGESGRNRSGDHVDLWNGSRLTDWFSWVRINARIGGFGVHSIPGAPSDLAEAGAVWFWRVV